MKRVFGRKYAEDPRDRRYLLKAPRQAPKKPWRYWYCQGWWGDQGSTAACVGFSWVHWLEDGPVTHKAPAPILDPHKLYNEAKEIDEWEGEDYDGTSVRAGAKLLKSLGFIEKYLWAPQMSDVIYALLYKGPIVVGTWWYESMSYPNRRTGRIEHLDGYPEGGHAYVLNGINLKSGWIRLKNSWGRDWGKRGSAFMKIEDMERLLQDEGEACLAVENAPLG